MRVKHWCCKEKGSKERFHLIGSLASELILQTDVSKAKLYMCGNGIITGVVLLL